MNRKQKHAGRWRGLNYKSVFAGACLFAGGCGNKEYEFNNPKDPESAAYKAAAASSGNSPADGCTTNCATATPTPTGTDGVTPSPTASPSPSATATPAAEAPFLSFPSVPQRTFCDSGTTISGIVGNPTSSTYPWIVQKTSGTPAKLFSSAFLPDSATLADATGTFPAQLSGLETACESTSYDPIFLLGAVNSQGQLHAVYNCTGGGVNRYWKRGINIDGSLGSASAFLGNTLLFSSCTFNSSVQKFKCGNRLVASAFGDAATASVLDALNLASTAETKTSDGFAFVVGSTLHMFRSQTATTACTASLGAEGAGLVSSSDGSFVFAYNGMTLSKVSTSSCSRTAIGTTRETSLGISGPPRLTLSSDGNIVALWEQTTGSIIEKVSSTNGSLASIVGKTFSGTLSGQRSWIVKAATGSRIVVLGSSGGCQTLEISSSF
jgi:hypothetical protein